MAKILIFDDSPTIHRMLTKRLESSNHKVVFCATDGSGASELYIKYQPDLVLMDITMPNCDGREGLKKIMSKSPEARVLMLSAISEPTVVEECIRNGAVGFASKDQLVEVGYIEKLVNQYTSEKQAS